MIPVCQDIEFSGEKTIWFFDEGEYIRKNERGETKSRISGLNLPNPEEMWRARCQSFGVDYPAETTEHPKTKKTIRLKPTEAVFKLFSHWESVNA